jgi:hypothetical protein
MRRCLTHSLRIWLFVVEYAVSDLVDVLAAAANPKANGSNTEAPVAGKVHSVCHVILRTVCYIPAARGWC